MDCSWPDSSVHGILQARILEWVAMPASRGSSWLRNRTWVSCIAGRFFTDWASRAISQIKTIPWMSPFDSEEIIPIMFNTCRGAWWGWKKLTVLYLEVMAIVSPRCSPAQSPQELYKTCVIIISPICSWKVWNTWAVWFAQSTTQGRGKALIWTQVRHESQWFKW